MRDTWGRTPIRVTDLAITPDFTKLVAIGMYDLPTPLPAAGAQPATEAPGGGTATPPAGATAAATGIRQSENRVIVYDLLTKQLETCVHRCTLNSHGPALIRHFLSLTTGRYEWRAS